MAHRINVMLEDNVWEQLQSVPGGERSRFINEVISHELLRRRQAQAWAALQTMRGELQPPAGRSEDWVREDRDAHV